MDPNREPLESDVSRVRGQLTGRLSALGIDLDGGESPEQLARLSDAIERFEDAVEAAGGDLMVDEPPRGQKAQPDGPDFALPRRNADESIDMYIGQLEEATQKLAGRDRYPSNRFHTSR
jgi:hypothetical protein